MAPGPREKYHGNLYLRSFVRKSFDEAAKAPAATRCHEGQTWKPHYEGSFDGLTRIYTFGRVKKCRGSPATSVSRGRVDTENQFTHRSTGFDGLNRPREKNNYLAIALF